MSAIKPAQQMSLILTDIKAEVAEVTEQINSDKNENVTIDQILAIPFMGEKAKAIPLTVARSGAFTSSDVVEISDKNYMQNVLLYQNDQMAIKFSGHHLTQADADVWIQVIDLMKNKKFGTDGKIKIKRSAMVALLDWGRSGANYAKLLTSFKRLVESTFYIESKDDDQSEKKKSQPLRMFEYVQDGEMLTLWIPKESMPLFSRMSMINWSARLALGGRMGLAKAIQIYASSVSHDEDHRMRLAELKDITSYKSPDAKFASSVSRAFKELEAVGILKDAWVKKEYGVWMCGWRYNNVM